MFLSFDAGIMEISDNTFVNNRGLESWIFISTNANTDLNQSYTEIKNNVYRENEGFVIYFVTLQFSNLHLEQNVFTQN